MKIKFTTNKESIPYSGNKAATNMENKSPIENMNKGYFVSSRLKIT